jgi:hypothetical protein
MSYKVFWTTLAKSRRDLADLSFLAAWRHIEVTGTNVATSTRADRVTRATGQRLKAT